MQITIEQLEDALVAKVREYEIPKSASYAFLLGYLETQIQIAFNRMTPEEQKKFFPALKF